jgi:hypothetical protein
VKAPREWRNEVEPMLEIVPTEREEYERSTTRKEDDFWMWNTDPSKAPGRKERAS